MTTRRPPIRFRGYRVGVEWIARNDNSGEGDDLETVSGYISTLLLADLVGRTGTQVAPPRRPAMSERMTIDQAVADARRFALTLEGEARAFLEELADRAEVALSSHYLPTDYPLRRPTEGRVVLVHDPGGPFVTAGLGKAPPEAELVAEYLLEADGSFVRLEGELELVPVTRDQAADFIAAHHRRHRRRPAGWRFGVGLERGGALIGVAWAGRPTGPGHPATTLELQRVAVRISRNAATRLAGAVARAGKALGFRRLISFTALEEDGASLRAAGFQVDGRTAGGHRGRQGRPRASSEDPAPKVRWARDL
jgi:hypothetical protein